MITLQEAIELLLDIEEWEKAGVSPLKSPPKAIVEIASRERNGTDLLWNCQWVVDECDRIYNRAYRELIRAGKV